jgi:Mg-chelatase subunit ChlD
MTWNAQAGIAACTLVLAFFGPGASQACAQREDAETRRLKRDLLAAAKAGKDTELKELARELGQDASADTVDAWLKELKGPLALARMREVVEEGRGDFRRRVVLVDACARRKDVESGPVVVAGVGDKSDPVALVAVGGAGSRRLKGAVPGLVDRWAGLEKKRLGQTLLAARIKAALVKITGEEFTSAQDYRDFWAARGKDFKPSGKKTDTKLRPRFFNSEIASSRIVLVIDTSGSMRHGQPPRMERVKRQLTKLVQLLPKDYRFMIITYSGVLEGGRLPAGTPARGPLPPVLGKTTWLRKSSKRMLKADKSNKKKVVRFVSQLAPNGHTFTLAALRRALKVEGADTILLLSDGQPEEVNRAQNRLFTEVEILREVARMNRYKRKRIDTYGLGGNGDGFLKALAKANGGKFTAVK